MLKFDRRRSKLETLHSSIPLVEVDEGRGRRDRTTKIAGRPMRVETTDKASRAPIFTFRPKNPLILAQP